MSDIEEGMEGGMKTEGGMRDEGGLGLGVVEVELKVLDASVIEPSYGSCGSSGLDLRAFLGESVLLGSFERILVPTGISIGLPIGFEGQIRPRSGLAFRHGITVLNSPATIDSDYRGELKVLLINLGAESFLLESGMRVAQLVVLPYSRVSFKFRESLSGTDRGVLGFGSTGLY